MADLRKTSLASTFANHAGNVSDKWEHYLPVYDRELFRIVRQDRPLRLLEIGVQNGGSLQIWRDYLPAGSTVVGVDIDPRVGDLELGAGIEVHVADATDRGASASVLQDDPFDIIVDDGSHRSSDVITTFELLFDWLAPGGIYFIEDMHCSYQAAFGGGFQQPESSIEYFKRIIDGINADHFEGDANVAVPEQTLTRLRELGQAIAGISFHDSMVVIRKATRKREMPFGRALTGSISPVKEIRDYLDLPDDQLRRLLLTPSSSSHLAPAILERLGDAREEVGRLKQVLVRLDEVSEALAWTRTELDQSRHHSGELNDRISRAEAELDQSRRYASELNEKVSMVEAELAQTSRHARELNDSNLELEGSLEQLQIELTESRGAREAERLSLTSALAHATELAREYQAKIARAESELVAIQLSTTWRATMPLRQYLTRAPSWIRVAGRRSLKAIWWMATGQLRERLRQRRRAIEEGLPLIGLDQAVVEPYPPAEANLGWQVATSDDYAAWCDLTEPKGAALKFQARLGECLSSQPAFSILVPVFRTPPDVFLEMVASVVSQTYQRWELCLAIVDEGELTADLVKAAHEVAGSEPRIRIQLLTENLRISGNTNQALQNATHEWVVLLDHDDLLSPDALFEFAKAIDAQPDAGFIYSDKDSTDRFAKQRFHPLFKAGWSPETMLNANYLTHLCAMKTETLRRIGGWDPATDGAQDWDIFLRVIAEDKVVVHVPRVLYHWRWIETSVSAGGLDAKPYAAAGQIRALEKYLGTTGWRGGTVAMDGPYLRIHWAASAEQKTSVIVIGEPAGPVSAMSGGFETIVAKGRDLAVAVDEAIGRAKGDIIVLLDAAYAASTESSIDELVRPLSNPEIALVAGRVTDQQGHVVDYGVFFDEAVAHPAFRGESKDYYGVAGGAGWYRNASAAAGGALSFRRSAWRETGGLSQWSGQERPDLAFCLEVIRRGHGRLMLNPFAQFVTERPCLFERRAKAPLAPDMVWRALPKGDPYLNPRLAAGASGAPAIRSPIRSIAPSSHDFANEARHAAAAYDATRSEISASIQDCNSHPAGPIRRVVWIIPDFNVAFYGGINTILRSAEYMRSTYGVTPAFVVYGQVSIQRIRARIAEAFPALAGACEVVALSPFEKNPDFGFADAAVCTLWTTAYPLLRLRNVRRKFYFVQDWEPLFYPSGTLSTIVEATYRFGYHGICNTPSLASSYRECGGQADHFMPAINPDVFHARSRTKRRDGDPFVLVSYTRPGTPRNCFEALCEAMRLLKKRFGSDIEIITAGAEWNPAQYGLDGVVRNLGLLPYHETGALYRAADAGLVAMATRHPSYLPFEWMACGTAVVTNRNSSTGWLLRDGENCLLCEMNRTDVFDAVSRLIDDPELRDALAAKAIEDISASHSNWNESCETIHSIMQGVAESEGDGRVVKELGLSR